MVLLSLSGSGLDSSARAASSAELWPLPWNSKLLDLAAGLSRRGHQHASRHGGEKQFHRALPGWDRRVAIRWYGNYTRGFPARRRKCAGRRKKTARTRFYACIANGHGAVRK